MLEALLLMLLFPSVRELEGFFGQDVAGTKVAASGRKEEVVLVVVLVVLSSRRSDDINKYQNIVGKPSFALVRIDNIYVDSKAHRPLCFWSAVCLMLLHGKLSIATADEFCD